MKTVNQQLTKSYQEFLIDRLQDTEHAAGYLTAILEEKDSDPELLKKLLMKAIANIIAAQAKSDSEDIQQKSQMLSDLLDRTGESEIYRLVELLELLGFQLSVTVKTEE